MISFVMQAVVPQMLVLSLWLCPAHLPPEHRSCAPARDGTITAAATASKTVPMAATSVALRKGWLLIVIATLLRTAATKAACFMICLTIRCAFLLALRSVRAVALVANYWLAVRWNLG